MRLFTAVAIAALSMSSVAQAANEDRPPAQVAVINLLISDEFWAFSQNYLDPLFAQVPACKGVRLIKMQDAAGEGKIWLVANSVGRRKPTATEIAYEIVGSAGGEGRPPIRFSTFEPEAAVRLVCLAAKATPQ